ncbi:inactive beta-amylase 9 [Senna tora]|uniref:Beta-amylase n=1 Tax=Senna tora TaxID=362788 RepID=A0A834T315_9FABA|nr:inactive beta-amylase 9 [Senna tora]
MEVSAMIGSSHPKLGRLDLARTDVDFCNLKYNCRISTCFGGKPRWKKAGLRFTLKAFQSEAVADESKSASGRRSKSEHVSNIALSLSGHSIDNNVKPPLKVCLVMKRDNVKLYVGLPLDAVSFDCKTIKHARAIAAGLRALKLLGVEGVELPVWWGIVENDTMGIYDWTGYLAMAYMVQQIGLKLHVTLCFHGSQKPYIPLPKWVSQIGESEPSVFFADRSGQHYKECLSLAVDDLPVLDGKTPLQVYHSFCESFKSSFSQFMGSTITGISMGLGPNGELRYPSHQQPSTNNGTHGVGEFQCYDKNMLRFLKQHAEASGNPLWGLGGPHDAPTYNQLPDSNSFFRNGGSWESPYGDFFLTWYANQLLNHGDRLLSLATSIFNDTEVTTYGKVPLLHSWYTMQSHPCELAAGFYNTVKRDGYEEVAKIFAKNSCTMIMTFPGMDQLSDALVHPEETLSSHELLLAQIMEACRNNGVKVSGENSSDSGAFWGFEEIKKNIMSGDNVLELFMYHRMGASFFSPEHFPSFVQFVRSFDQQELHSDDLLEEEAGSLVET